MSMPLPALNGNVGTLAAGVGPLQCWEFTLFGFLPFVMVFLGEPELALLLPIAMTTVFSLAMPFVDMSRARAIPLAPLVISVAHVLSVVLAALILLASAISGGACLGLVVWLAGAAIICVGTLHQCRAETARRRHLHYSLRALFAVFTLSVLIAAAGFQIPGVLAAIAVVTVALGFVSLPALLRPTHLGIDYDRMARGLSAHDSVAPLLREHVAGRDVDSASTNDEEEVQNS
jgi:hypothetical protein